MNLYIDSQAAIKAITAYKVNSKLVNSRKAAVERQIESCISTGCLATENESSDEVARSRLHLPEEQMTDVPASLRAVNSKLEMYMVAKAKDRWNNIVACKVARISRGIPGCPDEATLSLLRPCPTAQHIIGKTHFLPVLPVCGMTYSQISFLNASIFQCLKQG